jgi:hypothetical protein
MHIAKNMEVIFITVLALVCATSLASAAVPAYRAASPVVLHAVVGAPMAVVTITGKRLSAAQKARLDN